MNTNKIFACTIALLSFLTHSAQMVVSPTNEIPVFDDLGNALPNAWCGGINAAHISLFDADFDGEQDDLFIFDKAGDRTLVFEGVWNGAQKEYHYMAVESRQFPDLLNFALLRDYDCDGKKDIFTYSSLGGGIAVYRNVSASNELQFEQSAGLLSTWYPFAGGFSNNVYLSSQDVPAIFDFEGDGDLDIMNFSVSGSKVELHLNYSVETLGFCSLDSLELVNSCYGSFIEGSEDNSIIQDSEILDMICQPQVPDPKSNRRGGSGARHVGSTILAFDATQDGLTDIVLGDVSFNNLVYLENSEGSGVDSVVYVADDFPADFNAPAVNLDNFPAGFYEDISGDGVRDLVVGHNNENVASNINSILYYENVGQDDLPEFNFIQDNFIQDGAIDYGESTAPALVDVNGDGLLDIVLGSRGEFLGLTEFMPRLSLFLNTGTSTAPAFTLQTEEWIDLESLNIGQYPDPEFGDIDGDGDLDLLLGDNSGLIHQFENTAGAGVEMNLNYLGFVQSNDTDLDVGQKSSPELYDLNGDNLLDLIIGERNGNINYYENTGDASNPNFSFITDTLGGLTTVGVGFFIGSSVPNFFELDGVTYLAAGSESGTIHLYNGIDNNLEGDFSLISLEGFDVNTGLMNNPFIANLNNDEYLDIVVGGIGGGLNMYLGYGFLNNTDLESEKNQIKLFPNPAQDVLRVEGLLPGQNLVEIYSVAGQQLDALSLSGDQTVNIAHYQPGIYLMRISNAQGTNTLKFVKK